MEEKVKIEQKRNFGKINQYVAKMQSTDGDLKASKNMKKAK